jgi:hypothetical protein
MKNLSTNPRSGESPANSNETAGLSTYSYGTHDQGARFTNATKYNEKDRAAMEKYKMLLRIWIDDEKDHRRDRYLACLPLAGVIKI